MSQATRQAACSICRLPIRVPVERSIAVFASLTSAEKLRTAQSRPGNMWPQPRNPLPARKACVRCPLLRVDPAQMPRLEEIHANLLDRLHEAKHQGWLGEVAAIETTMAAAAQKLEAMRTARNTSVHLGMPQIHRLTGRSSQRP